MFKTCPIPIDVQDLQFKLHCRLKVFNNKELETFPKSNSLISCASRYGLLFVGSNVSNLQVIQTKCVENYTPKLKDISDYPRRNVPLPSPPQHVCVNCDSTILAVVTERDNCPSVTFYDVLSFFKQNISIIKEVRLSSTPGIYVREIGWNPALPSIFTACKSDGTLGVYEIKGTSININELPAASEATCFCWSPKGKQIAVGSRNSRITQYKPDLKAVKVVNQPPLEGAHCLISLQWVSNYQFIGIYQSGEPEGSAKLIVVDAPKTGDPVYTNYEDVCYSGTARLPQFYMILQQHWNILMVASSNSTELGVLGSTGDTWTQWIVSDSARAELPLSPERQETLPVGLALDISSTRPLPWNESTIPPCPYLLILSHQGVLCLFNVVNLKDGVPSICTPPDSISDLSGIQQFVTPTNNPVNSPPAEPSKVASPSVNITQNPPVSSVKVLTQPQPTYAAPAPLFGAKPAEVKPLFGGQTVLTPIKPQQSTTQPLFGTQTFITPINKQQSTTAANASTAEKYSAIFSALNTPAAVPPPTASKTIVISSQNLSKPTPPVEQPVTQPSITTTPVKPVEPPKPAVNLKIKEETDILLAQMLRDESTSLESELKALLHQGKLLDINIGSENEKVELVMKIESLQEFIKEIVDISIGENAEVHYLKQNLIQSWAWYEEARSRYNASKDETISLLLRSQPLDSATEKKQADIRKLMYYIESQITQASKALDEQWDNFQDYAKKVHRTKMPTMEAIFQAMVRQNGILQKQCYILKDIANRLKGRSRGTNMPSLLLSMENTKDLEESLIRLKIEHPQDIYQMQYQRVLNRTKNLSETKSNKLRNLLKNREVLHVTAVKPQLSASLMLQSPESKSKRLLSNLASLEVSPLPAAALAPKVLSFLHSTPIRESKSEVKPAETQADTKFFTFKKAEKSNLTPTTNSFIPLSKSASVFSNLPQGNLTQAPIATHSPSAFVPTQVNFGGGGKFSFTSTPTTTAAAASAAKTVTISLGTTTAPTFSFASTTLPKFSVPSTPKTPDASTPTSSTKTSFNFGSGLTIVPLATNKKDTTTTTATNLPFFETATTTKSGFNFGGTSNLFGAKVTAASSPQVSVTTTSGNFFGNLAQVNKSSSATTAVSSPSTFGAVANTSKLSAFSAVSTTPVSAVSATLTSKPEDLTQTQTKPSVFANTFATDAGLTKSITTSSTFANFGAATTTTVTILTIPSVKASTAIGNSAVPSATTVTTPVTTSLFGSTTNKPLSIFQTSSTPVVTTEATSSTTPAFSAPTTTKQSLTLVSPVTTASVSTVPSGTLVFNVTTSTSTKPTSSVTSSASTGASTQNLPFGAALSTSNVTTTAPAASVFTSNTSSATTKPSFFGVATTTPQSSIFASAAASQPSSFSTATTQLQGISTSSATAADTTVTVAQPSIFGGTKDTTSSAGAQSFFGTAKTTSSQSSIFSSAVTSSQPSVFGNTTSGVGTTTQSTSIFGSDTTISPSQPSIFGSAAPSTQSSIGGTQGTTGGVSTITQATSIFNTSTAVPSGQTSVFGAPTPSAKPSIFDSAAPKTTTTSLFGSVAITTAQSSSIFGGPATNSTAKSSIFGATPVSNQSSIFGTNPVASTQQSSIFGGGSNTSSGSFFGSTPGGAATQTSIFGGAKSPTTTKPSIFGASQTSTTQSSIFGANTAPSTQTSVFGAASTTSSSPFSSGFGSTPALSSPFGQTSPGFGVPKTTASTFTPGFGSPTGFGAAPSTTSSIFGQPASFGSTSTSVFGTPTTATNIFGSSTSTFGGNTSSNVFGSPVSSASSSFSFAGPANNTSNTGAFGFGGLNVGSPVTTNSVFGGGAAFGQATVANPFGRTTEQKSPFGGGSTSVFGNAASSSGSIFGSGSNTGSTFSSNTQGGGFGNSSFGSPSAFGQQSTFGQSSFGNTSFGNTQPGPFSSGSAAVAQTGFGSPTSFSKPSGFGSPPAFGGSPQPAFGGGPSFGAAPAFGTAATFGSPNKIFGASTPTAGFGSASTANAGFGNLANQNTVGFGNLAQQATTPNATQFSGSSSFSTWR